MWLMLCYDTSSVVMFPGVTGCFGPFTHHIPLPRQPGRGWSGPGLCPSSKESSYLSMSKNSFLLWHLWKTDILWNWNFASVTFNLHLFYVQWNEYTRCIFSRYITFTWYFSELPLLHQQKAGSWCRPPGIIVYILVSAGNQLFRFHTNFLCWYIYKYLN